MRLLPSAAGLLTACLLVIAPFAANAQTQAIKTDIFTLNGASGLWIEGNVLYVGSISTGKVHRMTKDGTGAVEIGQAVQAWSLHVDGSDLYIADNVDDDIWKTPEDGSGAFDSIFEDLSNTVGIWVDGNDLYMADHNADNLYRIDKTGGNLADATRMLPTGTFDQVRGVTTDDTWVYFTDKDGVYRVAKNATFPVAANEITTLSSTVPVPWGIFVRGGWLYIASAFNKGIISKIPTDLSGPRRLVSIGHRTPRNLFVEEDGTIYVTESDGVGKVVKVEEVHDPIDTFPYSESFESGGGGWLDTGTKSTWEVGVPSNDIIDHAYDGNNAWVTDLDGNNEWAEDSYVMSPPLDFSGLTDPLITLDIWSQSEESEDGANLGYSIDGGLTWTVVGSFGDPNHWYNRNTVGSAPQGTVEGWAGRGAHGNLGWSTACHDLEDLAGESDVLLRIYFSSNQAFREDEGIAFDHIRISDGRDSCYDVPAAAHLNFSTFEDGVVTLDPADFAYVDAKDRPLHELTVISEPTQGTLWIDADGNNEIDGGETVITDGTVVPGADVIAGRFKFLGGDSQSTFEYYVSNGVNRSFNDYTITTFPSANTAPSFTKGGNATAFENAGPTTVDSWATNISKGHFHVDRFQNLWFEVSTNNDDLFSAGPAIDPISGDLTFTPSGAAIGSATVTVQLFDSGGTTAGSNASGQQTFTISIQDGNDDPAIADLPTNVTVLEDAESDVDLSAAQFTDDDSAGDDIDLIMTVDSGTLSATGTADVNVVGSGSGELTLTGAVADLDAFLDDASNIGYTGAANAFGDGAATLSLTANDGGHNGNGGGEDVALGTVIIDITGVNDAPTLDVIDDITIAEDAAEQTVDLTGIAAGPGGESQTLQITAVSDTPGLVPNPTVTYTSPNAIGSLAFTPIADAHGSATITVTVMDDGATANDGEDTLVRIFDVTVNSVNDAPVITSAEAVDVEENTTAVQEVTFNDPDTGNDHTFSITDGADKDLFSVDASSGALTFIAAPNFEANGSDDGDNVYEVQVTVTDDGDGELSDTIDIAVTVTDSNDAPVISSADAADAAENQTSVMSVTATDEDEDNLGFAVTGGADMALFTITQDTGVLSFLAAPDFENPIDTDGNGVYDVLVSVMDDGDGNLADAIAIAVTVTNVNEAPVITVPDAQTTTEDTPMTFSTLGGNAITVADVDLEGGTLLVELTATSTLDLATQTDLSITSGEDGTDAISFSGSISAVNAALDGLVYTPSPNQITGASLTIDVSDGGATGSGGTLTDSEMITINITSVNDTPEATPDVVTTGEDTAITIDVLANDSDPDGDELSVSIATPASNGAAQVNPDGTITYTPNENFFGEDRFDYTATDPSGASDTEAVRITVTPVNDAPVAAHDEAQTDQGSAVVIAVLENDSDVESDVAISSVGAPGHGTAVDNGDGTITYTPADGFFGEDTFTYTITDGELTAEASVTVTVNSTNSAPVANADVALVNAGESVVINVLANDTDADGDDVTLVSFDEPALGTVTDNEDGTLTYAAGPDASGEDEFTYFISDGIDTAQGSVTVTIATPGVDGDGVDDAVENDAPNDGDGNNDGIMDGEQENVTSLPIAEGENAGSYVTVSAPEGQPLLQVQSGMNPSPGDYPAGASSPIGFLSYSVDNVPESGTTVTINYPVDAVVTAYMKYGPTPDNPTPHWYNFAFNGSTGAIILSGRILLFFQDGERGDDDLTVNGTIVDPGSPVHLLENAAPTAQADEVEVDEDSAFQIDVLANDTDADGDQLTVMQDSAPTHGSIVLDGNAFTYTPQSDFFGGDSFTYIVTDPDGAASSATVSITVTPVQDAPFAGNDEAETMEATPVTFNLFANDFDVDGDHFWLSSQDDPQHGVSVYNDDGTVTYTPEPGFIGTDTWVYTITDGPGASDATIFGTITVTVTADPNSTSWEINQELPTEVFLNQNYPNPFNPSTTIEFGLPKAEHVRLEVFDVTGRLVRVFVDESLAAGRHVRRINLGDVQSGVYIYRLSTGERVLSKAFQMVK